MENIKQKVTTPCLVCRKLYNKQYLFTHMRRFHDTTPYQFKKKQAQIKRAEKLEKLLQEREAAVERAKAEREAEINRQFVLRITDL